MFSRSNTEHAAKGWFESQACFWACALTCAFNGIIYAFPMLTPKLQDAGLDSSDVVIAGVMLQLGFGSISYPFAKFYTSNFMNLSPFGMDRLVSIITTIIVCGALCLLIAAVVHAENKQTPLSLPLVCVGFFLWSAGLGFSFYQSMTIVNFLFASDKALRRKAVAFMTFAVGIGSCSFVILFYYAMTPLSLVNNYVTILCIFLLFSVLRVKYMVRDRFEEIPTLRIPGPSMIPGSLVLPSLDTTLRESEEPSASSSSLATLRHQDLEIPGSDGTNELALRDIHSPMPNAEGNQLGLVHNDDSHLRISSGIIAPATSDQQSPVFVEHRPTRKEYLESPVVWLTAISAFFAFGIGSIFLNSLGNLAQALVNADEEADKLTFNLTMTFLAMIILARLVGTIIYAHWNWPHVNTMWNAMLFGGLVIYVAYPSLAGAYLSSAFIGFGFGGIVSCMAVISTVSFPGGVLDGSMNLAIAYTVTSPGPFILGLIQTVIYEKSSLSSFDVVEIKSTSTYIYFLSATLFSTICSIALGIQLKHLAKLELESLSMLRSEPAVPELVPASDASCQEQIIEMNSTYYSRERNSPTTDLEPSALEKMFM